MIFFEGDGMFQAGSFSGPQDISSTEGGASPFMLRAARMSREERLYQEILSAMSICNARQVTYIKGGMTYTGSAIMMDISEYAYTVSNSNMDSVYYLYAKAVNSNPRYFYYIPNVLFASSDGFLSVFYMMVNTDVYNQKDVYESEIGKMTCEAVPDAAGMSETEIALAAHDYLVSHTCYDWDAFYGANRYENYPDSFSAYGAIVNKRAVCQGLSLAYMDMLSRLGVQSAIVPSYTLSHAWNLVCADGKWYHADITSAGDNANLGRVKHNYFMLSDAESQAIHHGAWSSDGLVEASASHDNTAFWHDVESSMYYINGYWYYNDGTINAQQNRCEGALQRTRYGVSRSPESLFSNVSFPTRLGDTLLYCNYSDNTLDTYTPATGQSKSKTLLAGGSLAGIGVGVATSGAPVPSGYLRYTDERSSSAYFCANDSLGDLDCDSSVNVRDLLLVEQIKNNSFLPDDLTRARADVDWNAAVDGADSEYLQRFIVRLISKLPAAG